MKKINIIFSVLILALTVVGCETYDDYQSGSDRLPLIGFPTKNLPINRVPAGEEISKTLNVFITEASSVDRTFQINAIADPAEPAAAENYRFDSTVTIPANERHGSIEFTAIDVSLTTESTSVILSIEGTPEVLSGGKVTVSMKK